MFNDFKGYDENGNPIKISIPPTLLISVIGVVNDISKTVSPEFKEAGDIIYLLGETNNELGGSEYYRMLARDSGRPEDIGKEVPKVDFVKNTAIYSALENAIKKDLVTSAISVHSGGLGIALAKASVGGMLGCKVSVENLPGNALSRDAKLFSESQGRVVVSVVPVNVKKFEKNMKMSKIPFVRIGLVTKEKKLIITEGKKRKIIESNIDKLLKNYHEFSDSQK